MKRLGCALLWVFVVTGAAAAGQEARIVVRAGGPARAVSRYMTGACIEDVNHEVYGGIYGQMIFGESFAEPAREDGVSGMWREVRGGAAVGSFAMDSTSPFVGRSSQKITFADGRGEVGIENRGLNRWGMHFARGQTYEGRVWARTERPTPFYLRLESGDGKKVYAEARMDCPAGDWHKFEFTLTPDMEDDTGRFAIVLKEPGAIEAGYVFLEPGDWGRFKGLPVRRDVAGGLLAQGLTVLRYGGSMVNAPQYRWKKMTGARDRRPPHQGTWYGQSSNGWGIIDFLSFCEAAGFLPVPAFNMDETPRDMADFVEYVNGSADTKWGRMRAEDGHPQPFGLAHIELGNEEAVDEHYRERFEAIAGAVWEKDPRLVLVVGDFAYGQKIVDPYNFRGAPRIRTLAAHRKILDLAREHGREVWFDVHLNTERPRDPAGLGGLESFIDALGRLSPGANYKVVVFELNANRRDLARALSNAFAINQLERLGGERVPVVCSANCLQCDGQNDNGWDQGLLFLNPSKVWPQPPYYVTQMLSKNYLPLCIEAEAKAPPATLDVTATASPDRKTIQLQVVNTSRRQIESEISFDGFVTVESVAQVDELKGDLDAVNTADFPGVIQPRRFPWNYQLAQGATRYPFPPDSFTILRFK
ncbi:MAG TPA: alpha-L-arabinofuranosidase C-terminal domain-containing protein [Tepidisphaeraceae bacterium]|nr:alpha-L-arabinofuranosidase C-terminal domain-containing protein [Tepidisphaeraceae bacterium]